MIVGLTGGIGSGKTTVAKIFEQSPNIKIYIADDEAKKLMLSDDIKTKIIDLFGVNAYQDNLLNKKYIADIVFNNQDKLSQLNQIIHPAVYQNFQDFVKNQLKKSIIIYESAILFETGYANNLDFVISVLAPEEVRIQRVLQRDDIEKQAVLNRMSKQWTDEKRQLLSHYIIHNIFKEELSLQIKNIYNKLTKKIV